MKKLIMALAAIPVLCGAAFGTGTQGFGIPTGSLLITTVQGAGVLQSASGYNYTVTAYATFANGGKFDPQGTIGIERYWQGYDSNGNLTGAPTAPVNDGMWWPANSGFDKTKGRAYGPYVAGYPGTCTSTSPQAGGYGVETLLEVYNDTTGTHTIATYSIQILPNLATQNSPPTGTYSNVFNPSGPVLNFISN